MKMRGFAFNSDPSMLKFTETAYETSIKLELGKVNLNKDTGIYKKHICNGDPTKMRVLPSFRKATK